MGKIIHNGITYANVNFGMGRGMSPVSETSLVPVLTGDNPNVISSGYDYNAPAWHVFDGTDSSWVSQLSYSANSRYVGYKFNTPVLCNKIKIIYINDHAYFPYQYPARYMIQGSLDNGTTWEDIFEDFWTPDDGTGTITRTREVTFENSTEYNAYRLLFALVGPDNQNFLVLAELQFIQVVYG